MRRKQIVVASLLAGALAVAGATTLAKPREQNLLCQECVDFYHDDVDDCRDLPGPERTKCRTIALNDALDCLEMNDCPIGRNRR